MRTPTPDEAKFLNYVENEHSSACISGETIDAFVTDYFDSVMVCTTHGWVVGQYPDLRLTDAGRTALQTARITS